MYILLLDLFTRLYSQEEKLPMRKKSKFLLLFHHARCSLSPVTVKVTFWSVRMFEEKTIALRAFIIWQETGRDDASANWFQAIEELESEQQSEKQTFLSFQILDDLHPVYGPVHLNLEGNDVGFNSVYKALLESVQPFLTGEETDPSGWFFKKYFRPREIARNLLRDQFCVFNRFEKYYVFAWALNGVRFEVFSKDVDKELIEWGESKNGPVVDFIEDLSYNENPVLKLMQTLH